MTNHPGLDAEHSMSKPGQSQENWTVGRPTWKARAGLGEKVTSKPGTCYDGDSVQQKAKNTQKSVEPGIQAQMSGQLSV